MCRWPCGFFVCLFRDQDDVVLHNFILVLGTCLANSVREN